MLRMARRGPAFLVADIGNSPHSKLRSTSRYLQHMERILYPNRLKLTLFAALSLMFSLNVGFAHGRILLGFLSLVAACVFSLMMLPGATSLTIGPEGFVSRCLYRSFSYKWAEIEHFGVVTRRYMGLIPISRKVGFRFSEHYAKYRALRKITRIVRGYDGLLADNYGMSAKELAALLEVCRARAASRQSAPVAV